MKTKVVVVDDSALVRGLLAEIDITGDGPGHINTTTKLPFGKFVVLAQVAAPGDGGAPRLYIVRAEPVAG